MDALASEYLILVVAAVILVNRGFERTSLRLLRPAYVIVQAFDLVVVAGLSMARIHELPTKADFIIRIFLMLFVAYHMVINSQSRGRALQNLAVEEAKLDERRERLARAAALDAELQTAAGASSDESVTEPTAD